MNTDPALSSVNHDNTGARTMMFWCPLSVAMWSGVQPRKSEASTRHPDFTRMSIRPACPYSAARCRAGTITIL